MAEEDRGRNTLTDRQGEKQNEGVKFGFHEEKDKHCHL